MNDLQSLYQEVIIDHNRSPRNFGRPDSYTHTLKGHNPLCGDVLTVYLRICDERIDDIHFDGDGCAISVASASLMTDQVKGMTREQAETLFENFHELVSSDRSPDADALGKLTVLAGVRAYPSRVKCATLCWHTLRALLHGEEAEVSTE